MATILDEKRLSGESYEAVLPDKNYCLNVKYVSDDVNDLIEKIRNHNRLAKKKGVKPDTWLVIKTWWEQIWSQGGDYLGGHTSGYLLYKIDENGEIKL